MLVVAGALSSSADRRGQCGRASLGVTRWEKRVGEGARWLLGRFRVAGSSGTTKTSLSAEERRREATFLPPYRHFVAQRRPVNPLWNVFVVGRPKGSRQLAPSPAPIPRPYAERCPAELDATTSPHSPGCN